MAKVNIAQSAHADLRSIGAYTLHEWGSEQMRRYMGLLRAAIASVGERPLSGRSRDDLSENMRAWPAGSHVIFTSQTPMPSPLSAFFIPARTPDPRSSQALSHPSPCSGPARGVAACIPLC